MFVRRVETTIEAMKVFDMNETRGIIEWAVDACVAKIKRAI